MEGVHVIDQIYKIKFEKEQNRYLINANSFVGINN